jgi:hypothetical protein
MRQLIKRILKEQTAKNLTRIITKLLETSILSRYEGLVCGIKVTAPEDRETIEPGKEYLHYKVNVYFIGGPGTEFYPKTMAIREMYDKIMYEIWDIVESHTGEPADIFSTYLNKCDNNINEDDDIESNDDDYSPQTIKIIEKLVGRIDLPMVDKVKVLWSEEQGMYRVQLYYPEGVSRDIKWKNESMITGPIKSFLDLPPYTLMVATYTIPNKK